ncbi:MAG: ribonuclease HII [Alphaproteobacteria bacterium]|nr:ribonuclease HII [Alphaproteobacteria bacterium]
MPDLSLEHTHDGVVAGVDEAGRGPWAGPVVAAAVILHRDAIPAGINDSKQLSAGAREMLHDAILASAICGIAEASVEEIDRLNIWGATQLAMQRAVAQLTPAPTLALVDGKLSLPLACAVIPVVGGDAKSLSIAAASILAKVTRDRLMRGLHEHYPAYGWESNAGYGTAQHIRAIERCGITPHHRRSFKPIRAYLDAQQKVPA